MPIKNTSGYEYSDNLVCFFNTEGKLKLAEQLIGTGYEDMEIYLTENNTIIYGSFMNSLTFFDFKLNYLSNRSSNFLIFTDKELK